MVSPTVIDPTASNTGVIERSALGDLIKLKEGGQGFVYDASALSIGGSAGFVFKEYKPAVLPTLRMAQLDALVGLPAEAGSPAGEQLLATGAWPLATVQSSGRVVGFVMARVPNEYWRDMHLADGRRRRDLGQFMHLMNSDKWLRWQKLRVSDHARVLLLQDVAEKMAFLHSLDVAVGDISAKNLLFTLGSNGSNPRCYFIDCDAMRLRGGSVLEQAETPGWDVRAVSAEPLGTPRTDVYKLGLLTVRLFARDQTTRQVADAKGLPGDLQPLAQASLASDPAKRPSAREWADGLLSAAQPPKPKRTPVPKPKPTPVPKPPRPKGGGPGNQNVAPGPRITRNPLIWALVVPWLLGMGIWRLMRAAGRLSWRIAAGLGTGIWPLMRAAGGLVQRHPRTVARAALLALVSGALHWLCATLGAGLHLGYVAGPLVGVPLMLYGWSRRDRGAPYSEQALAVGALLAFAGPLALLVNLGVVLLASLLTQVLKGFMPVLVFVGVLALVFFWLEWF
jgi:hypothetical protein